MHCITQTLMPPKPKAVSNKKNGTPKRTLRKPNKSDSMEDNSNASSGIEATQNLDISGKLDRMMSMMDVLARKVAGLEITNNPGTATAAPPAPIPITSPAAAAPHSSSSHPIEIEETVCR